MLFSSQQKGVVFLSGKTADLFVGENKIGFNFPPEMVSNLEISSREKFVKYLVDVLRNNNLVNLKIILFLRDEVVFQKEFIYGDSMEDEIKKFEANIPFSTSNLEKFRTELANGVYYFVTNKDFIDCFIQAMNLNRNQIILAVPESIVTEVDLKQQAFTAIQIKNMFQYIGVWSKYSFLKSRDVETSEPLTSSDDHSENSFLSKINGKYLIYFGLLLLSFGVLFGAIKFSQQPTTPIVEKKPDVATPSSEIKPAKPVETASESAKTPSKSDVKIQVLNGTGTAGEASKAKDLLIKLGYTDVQTGNAAVKDSVTTIVTSSPQVSKDITDDIVGALKIVFKQVVATTSSTLVDYDLSIVTGK